MEWVYTIYVCSTLLTAADCHAATADEVHRLARAPTIADCTAAGQIMRRFWDDTGLTGKQVLARCEREKTLLPGQDV